MEEILIIKIIFCSLLTLGGLVLLILSFKLYYKYLIQEKKCLSKTKGIITTYTITSRGGENGGIHLPVVFYEAKGKKYKIIGPEYKGYKILTVNNPTNKNSFKFSESDEQILTIQRNINSFIKIYKNPMQELYPLNSKIDVYYDPTNPKLSYVLRYCNKKWAFYLTFISSLGIFIVDLLLILL